MPKNKRCKMFKSKGVLLSLSLLHHFRFNMSHWFCIFFFFFYNNSSLILLISYANLYFPFILTTYFLSYAGPFHNAKDEKALRNFRSNTLYILLLFCIIDIFNYFIKKLLILHTKKYKLYKLSYSLWMSHLILTHLSMHILILNISNRAWVKIIKSY